MDEEEGWQRKKKEGKWAGNENERKVKEGQKRKERKKRELRNEG